MWRDVTEVRAAYEANCLATEEFPDIALRRVEFHFIAANEAWDPPGGTFDPEVLISPNAFYNAENGYGFKEGRLFSQGEQAVVRAMGLLGRAVDLIRMRTRRCGAKGACAV